MGSAQRRRRRRRAPGAGYDRDNGSHRTHRRPATARRAERLRLLVQPALVLILAAGVLIWAFDRDLTVTQQASLNASNIAKVTWQHVLITVTVVLIVVALAVPLGTLLSRPRFRRLAPFSSASPISVPPHPPSA